MMYRTDDELERMWWLAGAADISDLYAERGAHAGLEDALEKQYERRDEQSEFRRELIERIQKLCDEPGTKKDLVGAIKMAIENSFVEL